MVLNQEQRHELAGMVRATAENIENGRESDVNANLKDIVDYTVNKVLMPRFNAEQQEAVRKALAGNRLIQESMMQNDALRVPNCY